PWITRNKKERLSPAALEPAKYAEKGKERKDCRLILEPTKIRRRVSSAKAEERRNTDARLCIAGMGGNGVLYRKSSF
ncbi:MAG: hypothetical protein ACYDHW_02710, partial [Syntrophorhabdaceae bacterium]